MCSAKPYIGKEARGAIFHSYIICPNKYWVQIGTVDNWYRSFEVAENLLEKQLTMDGTMRKK